MLSGALFVGCATHIDFSLYENRWGEPVPSERNQELVSTFVRQAPSGPDAISSYMKKYFVIGARLLKRLHRYDPSINSYGTPWIFGMPNEKREYQMQAFDGRDWRDLYHTKVFEYLSSNYACGTVRPATIQERRMLTFFGPIASTVGEPVSVIECKGQSLLFYYDEKNGNCFLETISDWKDAR